MQHRRIYRWQYISANGRMCEKGYLVLAFCSVSSSFSSHFFPCIVRFCPPDNETRKWKHTLACKQQNPTQLEVNTKKICSISSSLFFPCKIDCVCTVCGYLFFIWFFGTGVFSKVFACLRAIWSIGPLQCMPSRKSEKIIIGLVHAVKKCEI